MKAMIFAAGLGTRLKPLTDSMPKALVPVGGKPLLQILLEKLQRNGYNDIVVNVHHFADMIEQWLHDHTPEGMTTRCSDERQQLLETGGGIRHAAPMLRDADRFLIHNVDILSNVDLKAFAEAGRDADATLLVSERKTQRYLVFDSEMTLVGWTNIATGEVRTPHDHVRQALEQGNHDYRLLAFAGMHQMSTSLMECMQEWPERFSIIDFYLKECAAHLIRGYVQPDLRLMDVGKLDTLDKATEFLASVE